MWFRNDVTDGFNDNLPPSLARRSDAKKGLLLSISAIHDRDMLNDPKSMHRANDSSPWHHSAIARLRR
jgi:hypothetical protein